jgi:hypothetical protein
LQNPDRESSFPRDAFDESGDPRSGFCNPSYKGRHFAVQGAQGIRNRTGPGGSSIRTLSK